MRVHAHTKFCFLCVLTFIFHHCNHCHVEGHDHTSDGHQHSDLQISEAPYVRSPTASPESNGADVGPLEEEQRFYIQQLFRRYGQKDRLDFHGFQSLLFSLGLGEVKLVGVDHEDLGHDHVAHLDLLDVQEGLHSHSSSGEVHSHDHHDHKSHPHLPHAEQVPTRCSHTTASSPEPGGPTKQDHDHRDTRGGHQKHSDDHGTHDHNHDEDHQHQQTEVQSNHKDLTSRAHQGLRNHSGDHHHHGHHQTAHPEPPVTPTSPPKRTRKSGKARNQPRPNKFPSSEPPQSGDHEHQHGHDHHHQHDPSHSHKDKREAPGPAAAAGASPELTEHAGGLTHQHEECLNLTQLLTYYGLHLDSVISPTEFTFLCPALLYQIDRRVCIRHYHKMDVEQEALEPVSSVWVWIWGFVSITIISLLSLLGVVLVPILKQSCFKFLLTFLVALAVGTLSGDALLHLLPHSQGQHDHGEHDAGNSTDLATDFDGVWKGLTALAGIYLLFIIEHCIGMFKHYKDQRESRRENEERKIGRKLSDHTLNRRSDAEWLNLKPLNEDPDNSTVSCDNTHNDTQLTDLQTPDSPTNTTPLTPTDPQRVPGSPTKVPVLKPRKHRHSHSHGHGHSHGGNCHSDQEMKDAGIASIAWMVIMGDGMHNFSDGLAIGAAFSANITGGISTSVAVFCHELPHELGDFAVLLKAGMSVKQAIVYNLLSALMAYVGMVIGTAVGQYTHNVTNWIFAITAGMFLYVALVDMLPEMLHGDSEEHKRCQVGHFVLQNIGMLTGFSIMLLIAIFEERIVFDFGF
ncbi:zinc transporter ZIP10 [Fundulus heteroclitus]|uniref:zinc transporter ZIP10 n=1 Tax=Fundulus heteroclitus TaxID=8078 RepID=UPI00165CEA7E|nr:zinc transporter ZIP10 [Fundulus heteroclitus]XP_035995511.1 zinc transporter ZIP10 [Fundulus heteroclitus]XP_035995512.1 zinc transporter ZIP10 [Fundulus heteroclitus]